MPVQGITRYTCDITREVQYGFWLPEGWFSFTPESCLSPEGQQIILTYAAAHPGLGFAAIMEGLQAELAAQNPPA